MKKNFLLLSTLLYAAHLSAADTSYKLLYVREPSVNDQKANPQEYWSGTEEFLKNLYFLKPDEREEFKKEFFLAYMKNSDDTAILRRKAKLLNYLDMNFGLLPNMAALKEMIRSAKTNEHLDMIIESLLPRK